MFHVAVIVGSVRSGRFGPVVANWFVGQASSRSDMKVDLVDMIDYTESLDGFTDRIGAADAFVVVTPEYNHSFPGRLKEAIDAVRDEWKAKPVAFVAYGGMSGGLRAVEHLRTVFAELHAVTVRETVSFHKAQLRFDTEGNPFDPAANKAAALMLDQLAWWNHALRLGRAAGPYPC